MSRAFVFPGQGSQAVGMGVDLAGAFPTARDVFQEVDEALKQNLSKLMREGPESELVLTENAQPALMAVSVAVVRILEKDGGKPLGDAGQPRRRPFARRVFGPGGGRRAGARRCGAAAEAARPVDAEGGAGRRRRHGGAARHRARAGAGGLQGGGAGRGRRRRQRQWRRPDRGERPQGGGRAHDRGGQAARLPSAACCCR